MKICKTPLGGEDTASLDWRQLAPDSTSEGTYLSILGVDQYDEYGSKIPDNKLDARESIYRPDLGLIIFPARHPFDSDTSFIDAGGAHTAVLRDRDPELYDYTSMVQRVQATKYYLLVRISGN